VVSKLLGAGEGTIREFAHNYHELRKTEIELRRFMNQYRQPMRRAVFEFARAKAKINAMNGMCSECQLRIEEINAASDDTWTFTVICPENCAANAVRLYIPLEWLAAALGLESD
jgi:hypothetical protein